MKFVKKAVGFCKRIFFGILGFIGQNKVLSLILFLAALLRFVGLYPGYHPYHSDEGMSYSSAIEMIRNLNTDPTRYDYPSLVPLIHAALYMLLFIPAFLIKSLIFNQEDLPTRAKNLIELWQQVVIQNQQTAVLYWGRWITAIFGIGVVYLAFLVGKSFFSDRRIGLVAAALVAVNFRQVLNSHLALPDIYNSFFLLLSLLSLGLLLKNSNRRNYIFAGVAIALYFSVKYQLFTVPAFLLVHFWVTWQKTKVKKLPKLIKNFFSLDFLLSLAVIPPLALLLNPYHLIHWDRFQAINSYNVFKYGVGAKVLNIFAISYLYHVGIGKLVSFVILLGFIWGLAKYPVKSFLLLTYVSIFLFLIVYYSRGGYYTRNFVTLTPLLLIFASIFLVSFWDYIGKLFKLHKWLISLFLIVSVVFISWDQVRNSLVSSYYFSKPWGFKLANVWAKDNIPDGARIVSHPWDNYPRDKNLVVVPFEQYEIFAIAEMKEDHADFGFLNMDWLSLGSYWWMNKSTLEYWEKPNALMANTYQGIASRELADFTVAHFVKPWQSPDMNFLIVKIPTEPKIKNKILVANFSFAKAEDLSLWSLIDGEIGRARKILFDAKSGKNLPGSLKFEDGVGRYPILRATSPLIPLGENFTGKALVIEGWIRSANAIDKKARDGFLRVDFYADDPGQIGLITQSLQSNVSSRFFGGTDWTRREIIVFPPQAARFMSVGVQVNNFTQFWFDDIKVYHSAEPVENPKDTGKYVDYQIPDDILFPYSQGNL